MSKTKIGITYVMTHPDFRSVKVGKTSARSNRIPHLVRGGWQVYQTLSVESGAIAHEVESGTLFELRHRLHVPAHLTATLLPDGWSETSSLSLVSARHVWDLVCEQAGRTQLNPNARLRGVIQPPARRGIRRKGDTPKYSTAARKAASLTAKEAPLAKVNGSH